MDWKVLGIDPTTEKEVIEAAYNEKLNYIDLENRPEEFEMLHKAYLEAMNFADTPTAAEKIAIDKKDYDFRAEFSRLYDDFSLRISPDTWKTLLDRYEVFLGKERAEAELIDCLMDRHILPQIVWKYLNERYSFSENREVLLDRYPKRFVRDVILRGIRFREMIPFDMFIPGKNGAQCEEYLKQYLSLVGGSVQDPSEPIKLMAESPEQHPYGKALAARISVFAGETARVEELEKICAEYPGNAELLMELAPSYMAAGYADKCIETCEKVLDLDPVHASAKLIMAQALARQEEYAKATALITDVMMDPSTDQGLISRLSSMRAEWNTHVIEELSRIEAEGKADSKVYMDHAWRCLQNNMLREAADLAAKIDKNDTEPGEYSDLMNQIGFVTGNYELASEHADVLVKLAEEDVPGGKYASRKAEFYARRANTFFVAGNRNGAVNAYIDAAEKCKDDRNIVTMLIRILFSEKRFKEAASYASRMVATDPDSYMGHYLLAESLFEDGQTDRASAEIDEALELETGDLDVFVLKMRILIKKKAYGDAEQILELLKRSGAGEATAVKWCEGLITELKYYKDNEALDIYYDIAERMESGEYLFWGPKVYYRIAVCMGAQIDENDEESRKSLKDIIVKGLRLDPMDPDLMKCLKWFNGDPEFKLEELREL